MGDPELWAQMQRVEKLRYRAELLERASVGQASVVRDFLIQLAAQAIRMAEHESAPCETCTETGCCSACSYRAWAEAVPPAPA
jgi:hypothetical protein